MRRCKACSHPVKGHPGPFGLTRCRNREEGGGAGSSSKVLEQEIVELVTAFEAVDVDIKTSSTETVDPCSEDGQLNNQRGEPIKVDDHDLKGLKLTTRNIPCMKKVVIDSDDTNYDQGKDGKIYSASIIDETDSDEGSLLSDGEEFSLKIDDIVARLEESLLEDGKEMTDDVPAPSLDIRTILSGGQFCICKCPPGSDVAACQCEGELLLDRNMSGVVNKVYLDPVEFKQDWKPRLKCGARGWSKDKPGVIMLQIEMLEEEGVEVLEGNVTVEAILVKEGDEVNGVVRGSMTLVVEVGRQLQKKGFKYVLLNCSWNVKHLCFRNPVNFKPVKFQLIRFEEGEEQ